MKTISIAILLVAASTIARLAADDLFHNANPKRPTASFLESYVESVGSRFVPGEDGDPGFTEYFETARYNLAFSMTIPIAGVPVGPIDANTPFTLKFATFSVTTTLGNADVFSVAAKSAVFFVGETTLTVKWSDQAVVLSSSARLSGEDYVELPTVVLESFGEETSQQSFPLDVTFGALSGSTKAIVKGRSAITIRQVGSIDEGTEFELVNASARGSLDFLPPILSGIVPAKNSVLTTPFVRLELNTAPVGDAIDVSVSINGDAAVPMNPENPGALFGEDRQTGKWSAPVELNPGANTLEFSATDDNGNTSNAVITLTVAERLGNFAGILNGSIPARTGSISVKVTKGNLLTGKLVLGGKIYNLRGPLAADGSVRIDLSRPRKTPISVLIKIGDIADGKPFTGTVMVDGEAVAFAGALLPFDRKQPYADAGRIAPITGRINVATAAPPAAPLPAAIAGQSWFTASVKREGVITLKGKLPDGTGFTAAGNANADGSVHVYVPLYPGAAGAAGVLIGTVAPVGNDDADADDLPESFSLTATLRWAKTATAKGFIPAAFDVNLDVVGEVYVPGNRMRDPLDPSFIFEESALQFSTGKFSATGGGLAAAVTSDIVIEPLSKLTSVDAPDTIKLSMINGTGAVGGTFRDNGKARKISAVGITGIGVFGFALTEKGSAAVTILPTP